MFELFFLFPFSCPFAGALHKNLVYDHIKVSFLLLPFVDYSSCLTRRQIINQEHGTQKTDSVEAKSWRTLRNIFKNRLDTTFPPCSSNDFTYTGR
jgi:hypothetical protein